jgi:hypothetical protein
LSINVNAKVAIRKWFLLHLSGKFVSSFYDPLNKIILGKWPVMGRGQFRVLFAPGRNDEIGFDWFWKETSFK